MATRDLFGSAVELCNITEPLLDTWSSLGISQSASGIWKKTSVEIQPQIRQSSRPLLLLILIISLLPLAWKASDPAPHRTDPYSTLTSSR